MNPRDLADALVRARWQRDNSMVVFSMWDVNNQQPTLDITLDPVVPFAALWRDAVAVPMLGTTLHIASIPHLVRMKQHAGRPQDLADIEALQRIEILKPTT